MAIPGIGRATDTNAVDKSSYNLFHPVPQDGLRPLSAESKVGFPDATTLDAGHFQVDGDFFNGLYNSGPLTQNMQTIQSYTDFRTFSTVNVRMVTVRSYSDRELNWSPRLTVGLLSWMDFFVRPSYELASQEENIYRTTTVTRTPLLTIIGGPTSTTTTTTTVASYKTTVNNFETLTTGFKVNLWGNDGGWTAFAIRPYLAIPTTQGDVVGGGADLALLIRLPYGLAVNVDEEFYTAGDNNNYVGFGSNLSLSKALCSRVDVYGYWDSNVTSDSAENWEAYAGVGLDFNFTRSLQVFASMGFGIVPSDWVFGQSRPYDYNPRAGFVWRF